MVAIATMVGLPTAAQAVAANLTTTSATVSGSVPANIAQDDVIDVVTHGPIAQFGRAQHILYTSWSTQSLQLEGSGAYDADTNPTGLTYPEGWTLEYTTDGSSWSTTAPGDLSTVIAVRAKGDIKSTGRGTFETTSAGEEVINATEFGGTSEGDGYDVGFGNGYLLNSWHHQLSFNVECHLLDGASCLVPVHTISGYQTAMASSIYVDKSTDRAYSVVRQSSSGDIGVYCLDYSNIESGTVADCPTAFTPLADVDTAYNSYLNRFESRGSSTSRDGDKIWAIDVSRGALLCFSISANAACATDNGFVVGVAGGTRDGILKARVTAIEGTVFFTVNNVMGCFDPSTHTLCGDPDSTPIALPAASDNLAGYVRHAPLPIYSASGNLLGACDIYSQDCIDTNGGSLTMPSGLSTYFTNNPSNHSIGGLNAQQFAISRNKFYYNGPVDPTNPYSTSATNGWSTTIICWDFTTDALCSGWNDSPEGIWVPYSASIDPDNPDCVWINQDKGWGALPVGKIIPLNAATGEIGCAFGDPVIELPYQSVVPRMSCDGTGRVTSWNDITLNLNGISPNDVAISIFDNNDTVVSGWSEVDVDSAGHLDLSTLTVAQSSTEPSIQITGLNGVTLDELMAVTGTVSFDAEEPELCFSLKAVTNCPDDEINNPAVPDVPPGIIEGSSITYPNGGGHEVGSKQRITLAGTNSGSLCAATAWSAFIPALAETGFDPAGMALAGFGVLAAGIGVVVYTRLRRSDRS